MTNEGERGAMDQRTDKKKKKKNMLSSNKSR